MMIVRNIIFDFDGTLVDTAPLILKTMQASIRKMGLPERSEKECRSTIGLRLEEIPAVLWPDIPDLSETYALAYRREFNELKNTFNPKCFPEVYETLLYFHETGVRMAIASSRSHNSLDEFLELFGLRNCFSMLVGGNDVRNGKPSPDPALAIISSLNWNPSETLTVGDAPVDIIMGRRAGTHTCAVTYGNGGANELEAVNPDFMVSSFGQLMGIISEKTKFCNVGD